MANSIYGYARIPAGQHDEDRQLISLRIAGVKEENIVIDEENEYDSSWREYHKMRNMLNPGDTVVVKSIAQLGNNQNDVLRQWKILTLEKGAYINVLDMPMLNTGESKDLSRIEKSNLVIQLLTYVASAERAFMKRKQAEGIAAAKERGVRFGRKPLDIPENFAQVYEKWHRGDLSGRRAAALLDVSNHTFKKWCDTYEHYNYGKL